MVESSKRRIVVGVVSATIVVAAFLLVTQIDRLGISGEVFALLAILCVWLAVLAPNILEKWVGGDGNIAPLIGYNPTTMRRFLGVLCAAVGAIVTIAFRPREADESLVVEVLFGAAAFGLFGYVVADAIIPKVIRLVKSQD